MSAIYFGLGWLFGLLFAATASRIDGPAPTWVLVITGAAILVTLLGVWIIGRYER